MSSASTATPNAAIRMTDAALPQAEVNWDRLDKTKFYLVGAGLFSGVSALLYPISVVKTRMQVRSGNAVPETAIAIVKNILKSDGVHGLYRGLGTVLAGAVPSRVIFLTTLETTKLGVFKVTQKLDLPDTSAVAISNGIAGLLSSVVSQAVFVPLDVVSQRLMVQGTPGAIKYTGGIDAVTKIMRKDGLRGLYRGFAMSVVTYAPSSAVWWATYGSSERVLWRTLGYGVEDPPSQLQIVSVQAMGAIIAAAAASSITTPLDTVKTRLQVIETGAGGRPTILSTVKMLVKDDGWKGFYRGLGPRFFSTSLWGTCMITCYEYLKRLSVKTESVMDAS